MKILAIGAHPDDIEYGCGGTLLKYTKKHHEVYLLVLSRGDEGGNSEIREKEQLKSAKKLKAQKVYWGNFHDTQIPDGKLTVDVIEKVVREVKPDEVYVNYINDTHQDHKHTAAATLAAARYIKNVFYYEDYTSTDFVPDIFVDIEEVLEEKINLLKCHESQTIKTNPGDIDFVESVKAIANFRGFQSKVKYAEGLKPFRIIKDIN